ncbi:MAG: biopolymer transporter ExbD [Sphingobacteriales bacterium JAD_PAG50586_3]|nr:MAG: biopolymer transporter ExbD [Sphingobacteriales bacterium JAD_PAG50586_3]
MIRARRSIVHEINAGSIADIAFLLLIFFLLTSTMDRNYSMRRDLPAESQEQSNVANRNVLTFSLNGMNELSVNNKAETFDKVSARVKEFILNPTGSAELSEKVNKNVKLLGEVPVSAGVISIKTDDNTSYSAYYRLTDFINKAFLEMKDQQAQKVFGMTYGKLDDLRRKAIDESVPVSIAE